MEKLPSILFLNNRYIRDWEDFKNILRDKNLIQQEQFKMSLLCYIRDGLLETWLRERGHGCKINNTITEDTAIYQNVLEHLTGEKVEVCKSEFDKVCDSIIVKLNETKLNNVDSYTIEPNEEKKLNITLVSKTACNEKFKLKVINTSNSKTLYEETIDWADKTKGKEIPIKRPIEIGESGELKIFIDEKDRGKYTINISTNQLFTIKDTKFDMIYVEGDNFIMGDGKSHNVTSFYIGKTTVTQELWFAVKTDSKTPYAQVPITDISIEDCQVFIDKLNNLTGKKFRLPTEAEWEFAARGGRKSKNYKFSGNNDIGKVAWYDKNSDSEKQCVARLDPNELGLFDMSGNIWEWCSDRDEEDPYSDNDSYAIRGGSYKDESEECICKRTYRRFCSDKMIDLGLRLVLGVELTN